MGTSMLAFRADTLRADAVVLKKLSKVFHAGLSVVEASAWWVASCSWILAA